MLSFTGKLHSATRSSNNMKLSSHTSDTEYLFSICQISGGLDFFFFSSFIMLNFS